MLTKPHRIDELGRALLSLCGVIHLRIPQRLALRYITRISRDAHHHLSMTFSTVFTKRSSLARNLTIDILSFDKQEV